MFENTVNDVREEVVGPQNFETALNDAAPGVVEPGNTAGGTVGGEPIQQGSGEIAKPRQSAEENARFAEMRRELDKAKSDYAELDSTIKAILPGLKEYGFNGESIKDIADEIKAQKAGVSVEEFRASEAGRMEELEKAISSDPRVLEAERITREAQYQKDLSAVKAAFPEVNAESVFDLGEVFVSGMKAGLSPEDAYAAQLNFNKRNETPKPPKMGSVNQSFEAEKDTFSEDELNSLTKEEFLKNPKLLEKAMKSLKGV